MSPLSREEQRWLLELARQAITATLRRETLDLAALAARLPGEQLRQPGAAFVSLHRHGRLRGCVGYLVPQKPLYQAVADATLAAAFHDLRFEPVTPEEVPDLEIEISVLSSFFPIQAEQVVPGVHGLMVTWGAQRGLLLPQVATEYGWTREQFLEETCIKAGLERDAWKKGATLEAFTAFVFSEATLAAHHSAPEEK
ncbi:MAG: AmmeMemoRadiSam system protein A [Acidobacteria bacterium]|nr:AmmeMemoRadiSam system protein A [Acidobacteriota bacterium]